MERQRKQLGGHRGLPALPLTQLSSLLNYIVGSPVAGGHSRIEAQTSPHVLCCFLTTVLLSRCYDHFSVPMKKQAL